MDLTDNKLKCTGTNVEILGCCHMGSYASFSYMQSFIKSYEKSLKGCIESDRNTDIKLFSSALS